MFEGPLWSFSIFLAKSTRRSEYVRRLLRWKFDSFNINFNARFPVMKLVDLNILHKKTKLIVV